MSTYDVAVLVAGLVSFCPTALGSARTLFCCTTCLRLSLRENFCLELLWEAEEEDA